MVIDQQHKNTKKRPKKRRTEGAFQVAMGRVRLWFNLVTGIKFISYLRTAGWQTTTKLAFTWNTFNIIMGMQGTWSHKRQLTFNFFRTLHVYSEKWAAEKWVSRQTKILAEKLTVTFAVYLPYHGVSSSKITTVRRFSLPLEGIYVPNECNCLQMASK